MPATHKVQPYSTGSGISLDMPAIIDRAESIEALKHTEKDVPSSKVVYVRNLPAWYKSFALGSLLEKFGPVKDVSIIQQLETGCLGTVIFEKKESADAAIKQGTILTPDSGSTLELSRM